MNGILLAAVRQAINDSETAAGNPDDLLTLQATAAVTAMEMLGYIKPAGWEYAVMRVDVTEELGFNTSEQARRWADANLHGPYKIQRRPVGTWEEVNGTPGWPSESPEDITKGEGNV